MGRSEGCTWRDRGPRVWAQVHLLRRPRWRVRRRRSGEWPRAGVAVRAHLRWQRLRGPGHACSLCGGDSTRWIFYLFVFFFFSSKIFIRFFFIASLSCWDFPIFCLSVFLMAYWTIFMLIISKSLPVLTFLSSQYGHSTNFLSFFIQFEIFLVLGMTMISDWNRAILGIMF